MGTHKFKTTNIKGKEYVEVNQRLLFFRNEKKYEGWGIETKFLVLDSESCVAQCTIKDADGYIAAQGTAQEDKSSSYINKTSYIENCETSAVGRALAMLGIGIETSIASSNEVSMAIAKQETKPAAKKAAPKKEEKKSTDITVLFSRAEDFLKKNPTQDNLAKVLKKYEGEFSLEQAALLGDIVNKKIENAIYG
jgi:hypothetical protein